MTRNRKALSILRAALATTLLTTTLMVTTTSSASAHTWSEAIASSYGCGWSSNYRVESKKYLRTPYGDLWGVVYLVSKDNPDHPGRDWCVVTRKEAWHGTSSHVDASLFANGGWRASEHRSSPHLAGVKVYYPDGCHQGYGEVWNPAHDLVVRGTTACV
jgi:hypothetical protein